MAAEAAVGDVLAWAGEPVSLVVGGVIGLLLGVRFHEPLQRRDERRKRLKYARRIAREQPSRDAGVCVAGVQTRVHIVEGDGQLLLEPDNIQVRYEARPLDPPPVVAAARAGALARMSEQVDAQGVESAWNSEDLVAVLGYRITRAGAREDSRLQLTVCPTDYATFTATVTQIDRPFDVVDDEGATRRTTIRQEYFPDEAATRRAIERPVPGLANGLGVALLVFTDDGQVILSRRRSTATARPGERDVSVVEGLHTEHDRSSATTLDVAMAATRGCAEELGIQVGDRDIKILALGVDMTYHQWSFLGLVTAPYTAAEVLERHALHARDRWEARLEAVPAEPRALFQRFKEDGIWDLGLVTAYLALCHQGNPVDVQRAVIDVYGLERPRASSWLRRRIRATA